MNVSFELSEEELALFPPYDEYLENLKRLKNADYSSASVEEIGKAINDNVVFLAHSHAMFSRERFDKALLYRVRLNINSEREDLRLIQTYSYPPPAFCSVNGRANLKGKTVFYCSDNPIAAIQECRPQVGDVGYLSVWEFANERSLKAAMCVPYELPQVNPWHIIAREANQFGISNALRSGSSRAKHLIASQNFIAELFVNESSPYSLTSVIADTLLYGDGTWKDLIVYPSRTSNTACCNLAFHPNTVNRYLAFKKVVRFKVASVNGESLSLATGKVGEIVNTCIKWRDGNGNEVQEQYNVGAITRKQT